MMEGCVHGVPTRSVDDLTEAIGVLDGGSWCFRCCHRRRLFEVFGPDVGDSDEETFWRGFLTGVPWWPGRDPAGIGGQHAGLVAGLRRSFQGAGRQRCRVPRRSQSDRLRAQVTRRGAALHMDLYQRT